MHYYFIRVNGNTAHNDPNDRNCYVEGEPPTFPTTYFNYYQYCLDNKIIRIGWPDVGDLSVGNKANALTNCYNINDVNSRVQNYLISFREIPVGSIVLMPNKDNPGELYIGKVKKRYWYHYNIPIDPYECSHRVGVNWDRDKNNIPIIHHADQLGIRIIGGWWRLAFYEIQDTDVINSINNIRNNNGF